VEKKSEDINTKTTNPSVKELEAKIKASPNDIKLKKDLARAIINRYLFGEGESLPGNEADIKQLRKLIASLPTNVAPYARAYLAYLDHNEENTLDWLIKWAVYTEQEEQNPPPLNSGELYFYIILPFTEVSKGFWSKLTEKLDQLWPGFAVVLALQGYEKIRQNEAEEAIDYFVRALEEDENYWIAAWECAIIYFNEKNWEAAAGYYYDALKVPIAQELPDIHFGLAWCLGKLKQYKEEEKHYRSCLELDPDYPFARNNLGWSLLRQGKTEEALELFEESIKRGTDGKYPLYNKARALKKLGRFSEAIEVWKKTSSRGKLSKWVQEEIFRLQKMIDHQKQEIIADEKQEEEEEEEVTNVGPGAGALNKPASEGIGLSSTSTQSEKLLEEMIEKRIKDGSEIFGRKLQMYSSSKGGRQYAIPGIGRIDLLAEDVNTGDLIIIELKRDQGHDQVVGQISLYMGWIREKLVKKNQNVFGIICVYRASDKLRLAAKNIPHLEVFEYDLAFKQL
jgi:tetratricopeptide (TPR) repeat protein